MEKVLNIHKELLEKRLNKVSLVDIGEDTIRYDFFIALTQIKKIDSSDILLEYPIDKNAFIPRDNAKSKRKEKPQLDLVVKELEINIEFALFRTNSNKKGTINKTNRTVKMLNDMIRLKLDSFYTERNSFFICVADDKMIGHKMKTKITDEFPSKYYTINLKKINIQKQTATANFDDRFVQKMEELDISINAELIYNELLNAKNITTETRLLVWKIN